MFWLFLFFRCFNFLGPGRRESKITTPKKTKSPKQLFQAPKKPTRSKISVEPDAEALRVPLAEQKPPIEVKPTSTTVSDGDDGLHLKIRMKNHGMYNSINQVTLTDIETNLVPSELTQNYSRTSTANLGVLVGSAYTTFEGLTVGAAQTGYVRIAVSYTHLTLPTILLV